MVGSHVQIPCTVESCADIFVTGTMAPAGTYQLVVRALHIFGDKTVASEYDSATTVPFTIKYV